MSQESVAAFRAAAKVIAATGKTFGTANIPIPATTRSLVVAFFKGDDELPECLVTMVGPDGSTEDVLLKASKGGAVTERFEDGAWTLALKAAAEASPPEAQSETPPMSPEGQPPQLPPPQAPARSFPREEILAEATSEEGARKVIEALADFLEGLPEFVLKGIPGIMRAEARKICPDRCGLCGEEVPAGAEGTVGIGGELYHNSCLAETLKGLVKAKGVKR